MGIALAILSVLGTVLTFIFTQIAKRQNEVNHAREVLAKVEATELDAGMDVVDKLQ